jgi:three-Cys-motif partner protein
MSNKYKWSGHECPVLEAHSEAKHEILSEYIQKYLNIVCQERKIQRYNITLVDGFAGGGIYEYSKPGSPLVIIDAIAQADHDINQERSRHVKIDPSYFFIEKDKRNFDSLKNVIHEKHPEKSNIFLKNGDFNEYAGEIISHVKKRNPKGGGGSIFFLDQTGYTDVSVDILNLIRKELPKAEVIINISISWLIDFINDSGQFRKTISNMGIANLVNVDEITNLKENIGENRYIIESRLSVALQKAANFPYFRPFFIEPHGNHRGYWLLHLAPHYRAHNAMSEVIWEKGNYMRHYGGDGTKIFDLSYKGGIIDRPDIFGNTFNGRVREQHIRGLTRDIPGIIWNYSQTKVSDLMKLTCNNTAASEDMYKESILKLRNKGEIIIRGPSGGKKRSNIIQINDIIIPNKQTRIFLP